MDRQQYMDARHGFRAARKADMDWREPSDWCYREVTLVNQIPQPSQHAANYAAQFPARIANTFYRRLVDHGRGNHRLMCIGPKSAKIAGKRGGKFDINQRVALRSALKKMAEFDARMLERAA
jgi:hypothetical protein